MRSVSGEGNGANRVPFSFLEVPAPGQGGAMDGWWSEIDQAVCGCVARHGAITPAEIGRELGLSEAAVASVLALLVQRGRLRITRVELSARESSAA
jgi:hypothetical protein